jgi:hypothetical protein
MPTQNPGQAAGQAAPAAPGAQATGVAGQPAGATPAPAAPGASARDIYQGFRAQLGVLRDQRESLQELRDDLVGRLREGTLSDADRAGIDSQIALIDQQLAAKQIAIAEAEHQVATAAAVPGATVSPPRAPERLSPSDVFEVGSVIFTILAIPLVLAWARRIWRKSAVTITLPPELTERIGGMERAIDTVALEVERIGEGQRFVTQLMAGRPAAAEPLARGRGEGHV